MDKKISSAIEKFELFIDEQIESALKELAQIKSEKNRKHLQRLVYVNLINRFDSLVDSLLVVFSTDSESSFSGLVTDKVKDLPLSQKDFFETILSKEPREAVKKKIEELVRLEFLRERHSKKLRTLLQHCFRWKESELDRPRVNLGDGRIHTKTIKKHQSIPRSVIGYAEWLYVRRNALVHSDKLKITAIDQNYLSKHFHVLASQYIGIKLASIETAANFYKQLCEAMKNHRNDLATETE